MSVFYDEASLVLVPSGYKASKVYAQKPLTADGQLTFSRASTATRVGPDGLIEKVRTNLFSYSEAFDNAAWLKGSSAGIALPVVTANNTTAPDGTSTADKVDLPALTGSEFSIIYREPSVAGSHTTSVYLKGPVGGEVVYLSWTPDGVNYVRTACTLTTAWQRFTLTATTLTTWGFSIGVDLRDSSQDDQSAQTFFIWGAQLETGDIATDYIATTSAAVSVGRLANVPRLDYTNSTCPKLLLEPQRTNVAQYSEQFDNAFWNKSGNIAVTANAAVSPDGYTNADLIYGASSGTISSLQRSIGAAGVNTYTNSIFVKYSGKQWFYIFEFSGNSGGNFFDIQNGVLGTQNFGSGGFITPYGNGWYKVGFTQSLTSGNVWAIYGISNADNVYTNTASGFDGAYVWGAQVEAGAYATSYIPTTTAAVTRLADVGGNKTSASALIGQTEGAMFLEFVAGEDTSAASAILYGIFDSTSSNNRIQLVSRLGLLTTYIEANSVGYAVNPTLATLTNGTTYKAALAYSAAGIVIYVNGVLVYTNTSALAFTATLATISVGSRATIDSYGKGERISQTLLFKTRLTNAQLAELTSL